MYDYPYHIDFWVLLPLIMIAVGAAVTAIAFPLYWMILLFTDRTIGAPKKPHWWSSPRVKR